MRIVLNLFDDQACSRKYWLRDQQVARIGSTHWADFAVPDDPHMSGVHFLIRVTESDCLIRDLNSRNGTLVNGEKVDRLRSLRDGDLIMAGQTMFAVELDDQSPAWKTAAPRTECQHETLVTETVVSGPRFVPELSKMVYSRHQFESGVTVFHSICNDAHPENAARQLIKHRCGYFVVNMSAFTRSSLPPTLGRVDMLNDEIGLIQVQANTEIDEIVQTSWGKDATVFIGSTGDPAAVMNQLRSVVSAFSHPSVLRSQLTTAPNVYVSTLLNLVDAVLIERQDGTGWEIYSLLESNDNWKQLGFRTAPMTRERSWEAS